MEIPMHPIFSKKEKVFYVIAPLKSKWIPDNFGILEKTSLGSSTISSLYKYVKNFTGLVSFCSAAYYLFLYSHSCIPLKSCTASTRFGAVGN